MFSQHGIRCRARHINSSQSAYWKKKRALAVTKCEGKGTRTEVMRERQHFWSQYWGRERHPLGEPECGTVYATINEGPKIGTVFGPENGTRIGTQNGSHGSLLPRHERHT